MQGLDHCENLRSAARDTWTQNGYSYIPGLALYIRDHGPVASIPGESVWAVKRSEEWGKEFSYATSIFSFLILHFLFFAERHGG